MKIKSQRSLLKSKDDYLPDTRPISPCIQDSGLMWKKNTQCFSLLFEHFDYGQNISVLDLSGFINQSTLDIISSNFKMCFQVVNLKEMLDDYMEDSRNVHIKQSIFAKLLDLPHPLSHRVDVIFLWDLFCYLSKDSIIELMDYLALYCRPGSMIYYLNYTEDSLGEKPGLYSFSLNNDQALLRRHMDGDARSTLLVPSFRYSTNQLSHMMPSFEVIKYYMPQNLNMIEHLGRFEKYKRPPNTGIID